MNREVVDCCGDECTRLEGSIDVSNIDGIMGSGGGKTMDERDLFCWERKVSF